MERNPGDLATWLFDSHQGLRGRLVTRWIFLRALAAIYFSAFYSLIFQIKGLIGPQGILPAHDYLAAVARPMASSRYWFAPTLFWISSGSPMLMAVTYVGLVASVIAFANLWPRLSFFACLVCFLSFVAASGEFSGYQSDGMLLEGGFIALFFAPAGARPGWGANDLPSRASMFLLQWEWFRIYFESGMVKLLRGDRQWRNLTAMDEYYQNSPLPTWIGWYVAHLPHWFHAATAAGTLVLELVLALMLFFPRRVRLVCFFIVTPWEVGVILTGNYTFLNYLVLSLGFLLLDDRFLSRLVPARFMPSDPEDCTVSTTNESSRKHSEPTVSEPLQLWNLLRILRIAVAAFMLTWIAYNTTAKLIGIVVSRNPLPAAPVDALEPFRIANQYGLFAVMTNGRYEIEFQGSEDGQNWTPYPFRYKPQALNEPPGIYAPYQPRFDWNLWFASLGDWRQNDIVPYTEERLIKNDADVLALFRDNPFKTTPPRYVRAILWQYWFTSMDEKHRTGNWWRRRMLGLYAPEITTVQGGSFNVVEWPDELPAHD